MKIGIPRALLYYWYGYAWRNFWEECGLEVVLSNPTERSTIASGAKVGVDELCLPVKIFLGHLQQLAPMVDWVMIPHLINVEPGAFICPKFMGLPDLVQHTLPYIKEKMCTVTVATPDLSQLKALQKAALHIGISKKLIPRQLETENRLPAFYELAKYGYPERFSRRKGLRIGLLGHPYSIYDSCFNLNILQKLVDLGADFLTPEMTPAEFHGLGSGKLGKELFWTLGRFQFDALEWMLSGHPPKVDGFIHITPFACGPEAIIGDMVERRIKNAGIPLIKLHFEEQSGEAGMVTRLEAFVDLLRYRSKVC